MGRGLTVIGAGFGRTGTMSMKAALEQLGFGPTHHMLEVFAHPDTATEWAAGIRGEPWDVDRALAGFRSTLDFPSSVLWRELLAADPDAKVVLTIRSSESWWASFSSTIGPHMRDYEPEPGLEGARELFDAIAEVVFHGRPEDRDTAIAAFEAHNAAVVAEVPPSQLCVYEVGSGWEPLCAFLGVDVPDAPYPSSNSTAEWQERAAEADDEA